MALVAEDMLRGASSLQWLVSSVVRTLLRQNNGVFVVPKRLG